MVFVIAHPNRPRPNSINNVLVWSEVSRPEFNSQSFCREYVVANLTLFMLNNITADTVGFALQLGDDPLTLGASLGDSLGDANVVLNTDTGGSCLADSLYCLCDNNSLTNPLHHMVFIVIKFFKSIAGFEVVSVLEVGNALNNP